MLTVAAETAGWILQKADLPKEQNMYLFEQANPSMLPTHDCNELKQWLHTIEEQVLSWSLPIAMEAYFTSNIEDSSCF